VLAAGIQLSHLRSGASLLVPPVAVSSFPLVFPIAQSKKLFSFVQLYTQMLAISIFKDHLRRELVNLLEDIFLITQSPDEQKKALLLRMLTIQISSV
jgi:hypothetical protein